MSNSGYRHVNLAPARNQTAYAQGRRAAYPSTHTEEYPSVDATMDYAIYKAQQEEYETRRSEYNEERDRLASEASSARYVNVHRLDAREHLALKNVTQQDLNDLKLHIPGLEPHHHAQLVEPCFLVESASREHGNLRADFLEDHPYAYTNLPKRDRHVGLMNVAFNDSTHYRRMTAAHQSLAGAPPNYGSREFGFAMGAETSQYAETSSSDETSQGNEDPSSDEGVDKSRQGKRKNTSPGSSSRKRPVT